MKTILIVDDEQDLREFIGDELTAMNWNVILAQDGLQAYKILQQVEIDVVLTDIRLPKMDGIDFIKRIAKTMKNPPKIFVMSGYSALPETDIISAGAEAVFLKPFPVSTFLDQISNT